MLRWRLRRFWRYKILRRPVPDPIDNWLERVELAKQQFEESARNISLEQWSAAMTRAQHPVD